MKYDIFTKSLVLQKISQAMQWFGENLKIDDISWLGDRKNLKQDDISWLGDRTKYVRAGQGLT